jgi:hypothetical protein
MDVSGATGCARPKDRDSNDELNRADCGYGHPGRDFSAGIVGEVVSKKDRQQGSEIRGSAIRLIRVDHGSLNP